MQNRKIKVIIAGVILLSMVTAIAIFNHRIEQKQLENQQIQVQLKEYEEKIPQLLKQLDNEKSDKNKIKQELEKTQSDYKALQARKAEERRIAQERAKNPVYASEMPSGAISGNKQDWLRASGIPEAHWGYVDSIVQRESGWNPNAVNATSGACGLGQQLPCGKWAGAWNDPVAALQAMNGYVNKYGGWAGAYSFWQANHYY